MAQLAIKKVRNFLEIDHSLEDKQTEALEVFNNGEQVFAWIRMG